MNFKPFLQAEPYSTEHSAARSAQGAGNRFLIWYQTLVLGVALGTFYSNLPIYGYVLNPSLLPKYAYFAIFFLMAPFVLSKCRDLQEYLMSPFALWAVLLLVLNLIHLAGFPANSDWGGFSLIDNQIEARRALVEARVQYILFAIFLGFVAFTATTRSYLYAVVFLMIFLPCAVLFDFARPGSLYPLETDGAVLGRAGAMFINPTMAGEALLHVFLLGCAVTNIKYRVPLFLLCGAAVLATFSRSSIIAWALILFILVFRGTLPKSTVITMVVVLAISLLSFDRFESYLHSREELDGAASNILSRLNFFSSFTFNDDSAAERAGVLRAGWELFLQNPLYGAGAGATHFWWQRGSTHNQLLLFAAEYGIFGIGLWFWLLAILWRGKFFEDRGLQIAMAFLYAFMSLFTHLMLDSAFYWLATFAIISCRRNRVGHWKAKRVRSQN